MIGGDLMADETTLIVTLRKSVPNEQAGKDLLAVVKQRMSDNPDVIVTGHVTTHIDLEE